MKILFQSFTNFSVVIKSILKDGFIFLITSSKCVHIIKNSFQIEYSFFSKILFKTEKPSIRRLFCEVFSPTLTSQATQSQVLFYSSSILF